MIAGSSADNGTLVVLQGNGNGTLAAPRTISTNRAFRFVLVADFANLTVTIT